MNIVVISGNLGQDPRVNDVGSNTVANLSVAVSEKWKDKAGETKEKTVWVQVAFWGPLASVCEQYLTKGRKVLIHGSLEEPDTWQAKDGTTRASNSVRGFKLEMLGGGQQQGGGRQSPPQGRPAEPRPQAAADFDDDIPF